MKTLLRAHFGPALAMLCVFALAAVMGGCGPTGKVHKPTTVSNAGGAALVAYSGAGYIASKYFALEPCATPPVYPCKVKSVNDRLLEIQTAAYNAAKAADAVGASQAQKDDAIEKLAELKRMNAEPEVAKQLALVKPKGGTP